MNSSAICCGIYGVPVLALLDNSRTHYVEPLLDLLRQHPRLRMEHFSSYAPEPNSEEGVWSLAKREPAQGCPNDVDELMDDLIRSIDAIRSSPRKLRGCIPPIRASLSFALAIAFFTQSSIIQKKSGQGLDRARNLRYPIQEGGLGCGRSKHAVFRHGVGTCSYPTVRRRDENRLRHMTPHQQSAVIYPSPCASHCRLLDI